MWELNSENLSPLFCRDLMGGCKHRPICWKWWCCFLHLLVCFLLLPEPCTRGLTKIPLWLLSPLLFSEIWIPSQIKSSLPVDDKICVVFHLGVRISVVRASELVIGRSGARLMLGEFIIFSECVNVTVWKNYIFH